MSARSIKRKEIFLQPGELFFGGGQVWVCTLLGSCVSMAFWHPRRYIGGMCHYLLPSRTGLRTGDPDGRYADEAVEIMMGHMRDHATHPSEYEVKLIGGGNMFPGIYTGGSAGIGVRNIDAARALIRMHGFNCVCEHLDGAGHRRVVFDIPSGEILVRYNALPHATGAAERRADVHH